MVHIVIVSFTTVAFGIASLFLISRARSRLSEGSIMKFLDYFAICLTFIVIFSIWQTARSFFGININVEGLQTYPEYIFVMLAYVAFIFASFRVLKISEEFGFKEYGKKIDEIVKQKPLSSSLSSDFSKLKQKTIQKSKKKYPTELSGK